MNLESFSKSVSNAPVLLKKEIAPGDRVVVNTMNSIYKLTAMNTNQFRVSGGIYEKKKNGTVQTIVTGCGWGGLFVKCDALAVSGLQLKFGNRIITSPIKSFVIFRHFQLN